jgi:hypothetical protein
VKCCQVLKHIDRAMTETTNNLISGGKKLLKNGKSDVLYK